MACAQRSLIGLPTKLCYRLSIEIISAQQGVDRASTKKLFNPPSAASSFLSYGPPIVVHCSAGVRRSGTFCTLDYCIDELHAQQKVNVQGAVRRLRMQRAYAIQIADQYAFCYKPMLEYAQTSHKYSHRRT